ncbi:hypothetical protein [Actinomadura sp. NPDC049753]|uniref:hypothetical protein n=1 Tax=Actinomadura sp. NPDC049753 TaxID=3154739 RepID=UPI003421032D
MAGTFFWISIDAASRFLIGGLAGQRPQLGEAGGAQNQGHRDSGGHRGQEHDRQRQDTAHAGERDPRVAGVAYHDHHEDGRRLLVRRS